MATQIEIQNNIHLERILFKNPDFEQYMRTAVGYVLEQARKDVVSAAKQTLDNDPHGAARAVRRIVYKQILGGNLNILRKKRAGKMGSVPAFARWMPIVHGWMLERCPSCLLSFCVRC